VLADQLFLGENLLAWILLALGGELARAPVGRSLAMGALGLVAAIWALASLTR
jgi:hypothetical protein